MATEFGDYELLDKIAEGGMAELFVGKRRGAEGFEKIVAIKRILPELSWNEEFVSMFINEAKIAARLSHPNIVQIFDFGKIDNYYFIAMEYVAGQNLRILQNRANERNLQIPAELAALIVARAGAGLEHAHKKVDERGRPLHIVHRDVSPQNILVSYEGEVKVVDFGIAKAVAENPEATRGVLKGKLSYLSPEQVAGRNLDGRSDVFSLGLVLYEMLAGEKLFKQTDPGEVLDSIVRLDSAAVAKTLTRAPKQLREIVRLALHVDENQRYASAGAFQRALEEFVRSVGDPGGTMQLMNFMRLLFDESIGDRTMTVLRSELLAVSKRSESGGGSQSRMKRIGAAGAGALVGGVALFFAAPLIRAERPEPPPPPPVARATPVALPTAIPDPPALDSALAALSGGRSADAIRDFDIVFSERPDLFERYRADYVRALVEDGRGLAEEDAVRAEERFRSAIVVNPDSYDAHFWLAKTLTGRSDTEGAKAEYVEAIRLRPNSPDAHFNLGYIHFADKQFEQALERYRRVAELKPDYLADVYFNIAVCHEYLQQTEQAIQALEEGLREVPEASMLRERLEQLKK